MPVDLVRSPEHAGARSLGWLAVRWIEHFVLHGPGDVQGRPLNIALPDAIPLSDELTRFTADVYALDSNGKRLYDSAFYSRPKGADKSGHAARIGQFEALGPCRFAGWAHGGEVFEQQDFRHVYEPDEPMGRRVTYPFLRILATEEGQTGNVYDSMYFSMREGPLRDEFARLDDIGLTRTYLPGGGEIRPSTASSSAKDGGKETWCDFDETHLYTTPELRRMYNTVRRNMAKRLEAEPWSLESSTMYRPGEDSIAEASHQLAKDIKAGKIRRPRFYFNHREAPAETDVRDEKSLLAGLRDAYGDAQYMPFDRIASEFWDPRNDEYEQRRYFLNQVHAAAGAWVTPQEWAVLVLPSHSVPSKALVTLGLDGHRKQDTTALMGCEVETGHVFTLGVWTPIDGGEVERGHVDLAVAKAVQQYDVVGFYANSGMYSAWVERWEEELGDRLCARVAEKHPIAFNTSGRGRQHTEAADAFHDAVVTGQLTHDADIRSASHFTNAWRSPNRWGIDIEKDARFSPRVIDAANAAILARLARQDYLALPENRKRKQAVTWHGIWIPGMDD